MLATFDFETRGLWGEIFRGGYYDAVNGYKTVNNAEEFIDHIFELEKNLGDIEIIKKKRKNVPKEYIKSEYVEEKKEVYKITIEKDTLYIYAFNLEFDLSKIISEFQRKGLKFEIDYNNSLIINGSFHVVKVLERNIKFCDIYPLVGSSLDQACKSFDLYTKKIEIDNKEDYFLTVKPDDEGLNVYLRNDVLATFELLHKIKDLANLSEQDFVRCPTIASLSMKMFRINMPGDYKLIKDSELEIDREEFVRQGYFGGRVEVLKNQAENCFHYDVNSLYPYEMLINFYPVGKSVFSRRLGVKSRTGVVMDKDRMLECKKLFDDRKHLYMMECKIELPDTLNIGLLPMRVNGKLLFPVGILKGVWCNVEIDFAVSNGAKVLEIYQILGWTKKAKVFEKFVTVFKTMKQESTGAKRFFAKSVQNSLYGKFAMARIRNFHKLYKPELRERLNERCIVNAKIESQLGQSLLTYNDKIYADYIRPQFSAFTTAYSRIELLKTMLNAEKKNNQVYYCDTDSIVCKKELPEKICDEIEYGKWKLERKVKEGLYLLPKLYAEIGEDGNELLKSKGIIKNYVHTLSYKDYKNYFERMKEKKDTILYDDTTQLKYYGRRKVLQADKFNKNFDEKLLLKKRFLFSNQNMHKRIFDFENNTSRPINIVESDD